MTDLAAPHNIPDWIETDLLDAVHIARKFGYKSSSQRSTRRTRDNDYNKAPNLGLWEWLYTRWYQSPSRQNTRGQVNNTLHFSIIESLRAAHSDTWRFEEGWVTQSSVGSKQWRPRGVGHILAKRGKEVRVLVPVDYVCLSRPGGIPQVNDALSVTSRRDQVHGGFWTNHNEAWLSLPQETPLIRLYWNVAVEGAIALIREWTQSIANLGEPYLIKAPALRVAYARADAVVIYLNAASFTALASLIQDVHASLKGLLNSPTPRLAKPLAPGLAVAEDPSQPESFGEHRCRLIAKALANHRDDDEPHNALSEIIRRFRSEGLLAEAPYLNPDSKQDYLL